MNRNRTGRLFPKVNPYNSGFLNVGDGHEIYFEECGNPKGFPIVFFHGGPGVGCTETDRRFFNPNKWRAVLFDQRGSGRSRPSGSIANNTTEHLVSDFEKLTTHLKIRKAVFFGGSWGSTLALVCAIRYPKLVAGMVLRGIFLATKDEISEYFVVYPFEQWVRIETHYIRHNCFLEDDYIIKHALSTPLVPIVMVQGRYDMFCPPVNAFRLKNALPCSELRMVVAGHSSIDPETRKKLVLETEKIYCRL